MPHSNHKRALYEVISQTKPKLGYKAADKTVNGHNGSASLVLKPRKPKIIQPESDRIEFSVPYPLAVAAVLGEIVLLLGVFRLGQVSSRGPATALPAQAGREPADGSKSALAAAPEVPPPPGETETAAADPGAMNRIVIQTYQLREHLEPVKEYFAQFGIETEIRRIGDWYYLVTSRKYDNPNKQGTDGYRDRLKIIEFGENYKAPAGYETFGKRPFHDAYGMQFDN